MQNPYTNRRMIRNPAMFFGRINDLKRIYTLLANMQSISITGDRRMGKSSLLYCLAQPEMQQKIGRYDFSNHIFVHSDLQGSIYNSSNEFFGDLLQKLQKQLAGREGFHFDLAGKHTAFEQAVDQVNRCGLKLVFLFDEFDYVTKNERFDAPFFSFMRYIANNYDCSLITASRQRLAELCHQGIVDSPFFNIFVSLKLGDLEATEAHALITEPARKGGYALEKETDWVIDLAGQHPFLIQILCFHLFNNLQTNRLTSHAQVEEFFLQETEDHFKYAWQHMSNGELQLAQREAWQSHGPYHHPLTKSRMFRRFVQRQQEQVQPKVELITEATVKEALKNLTSAAALERSPLTQLRSIRVYLNATPTHLGSDYGKALQRMLLEIIHERLKPADENNKTQPKWRYWSILQWRYIDDLSNTDIGARLHIADRTYYREHDKAIDEVVTILQAQENSAI